MNTRAKAAARRRRHAEFEEALRRDYAGAPFQMWSHCSDCGEWGYVRGRISRVLRCFPCHTQSRAVRARLTRQRKGHA